MSLASSPVLIAEFADVLGSAKFTEVLRRAGVSMEFVLVELQAVPEIVYPAPLQERVCRDPDDDDVLACTPPATARP